MKMTKRIWLWVILLLIAVAMCGGVWYYLTPGLGAPNIGIVNMEQAVTHHPQYKEYKQMKDAYERMERTYQFEQQTLNAKVQRQGMALKQMAGNGALDQSLQDEFKAKVSIKEQALNVKMQQRYMELLAKYRKELQTKPSEADLQIVNLQLQLQGQVEPLAITPEDKAANEKRREAMQQELTKLLAERQPAIRRSLQAIDARIAKEMQPMKEAGEKELAAYAKEVQAELVARKQKVSEDTAKQILSDYRLPNPATWNEGWEKKLTAQKDAVEALHDAIIEDIKNRATVIQKQKHLQVILIDTVYNRNCVDVTNDIVSSYKQQ